MDVVKVESLPGRFPHVVSVHNSCHGVRKLGLSSPSERNVGSYSKIRDLLSLVDGITVREPERPDECCGFGGMFSMEEKEVSVKMGQDKLQRHIDTGAEYITGPDCSCLMHKQGIAKRKMKYFQKNFLLNYMFLMDNKLLQIFIREVKTTFKLFISGVVRL